MSAKTFGNYLAIAILLAAIGGVTVLVNLLAYGNPFLSLALISTTFAVLGFMLMLAAPRPGIGVESFCLFMLCAYVALLILWPRYAFFRIPGSPGISPARLVQLALILVWTYLVVKSPAFRSRMMARLGQFKAIPILLCVLLAFKLASIFGSIDWVLSTKGLLNEILSIYLPFFIAISAVNSKEDITKVFTYFISAAFVACLLGVYESTVNRNLFINYFDIDSDYLQNVLREKIRSGAYRIQSTFSHPLTLSECLAIAAPLGMAAIVRDRLSAIRITAYLVFLAIAGFVIYQSGSRSGIGAYLAAIGTTVILLCAARLRHEKDAIKVGFYALILIVFFSLFLLAIYLISDILIGRTTREFNSGFVRIEMWRAGLRLAAESPIWGYGQDMAAYVLGFKGTGGTITIDSYFLSVLLESGYGSLLTYILIIIIATWKGISVGLSKNECWVAALAVSASLIAFFLVKTVLSLTHNHGLIFILIGLLGHIVSMPRHKIVTDPPTAVA